MQCLCICLCIFLRVIHRFSRFFGGFLGFFLAPSGRSRFFSATAGCLCICLCMCLCMLAGGFSLPCGQASLCSTGRLLAPCHYPLLAARLAQRSSSPASTRLASSRVTRAWPGRGRARVFPGTNSGTVPGRRPASASRRAALTADSQRPAALAQGSASMSPPMRRAADHSHTAGQSAGFPAMRWRISCWANSNPACGSRHGWHIAANSGSVGTQR